MTVFQILDFNDVKLSPAVSWIPVNSYASGLIKYWCMGAPSEDLVEWLEKYNMGASLYTTIEWTTSVSVRYDGSVEYLRWYVPYRSELKLEIHDPDHALLFKLTWM